MPKLAYLQHIIFMLVAILSNVGHTQGLRGDRELLKLVAETYNHNLAQLRTWQGEASVDFFVGKDSGYKYSQISKVTFVMDRNLDALRWQSDIRKTVEPLQEDEVLIPSFVKSGILKEDKYFDFLPVFIGKDNTARNALVIWPKERFKVSATSEDFYPMRYFNPPSNDIFEQMMSWYIDPNRLVNSGDYHVYRVENCVKIECSYTDTIVGKLFTRYEFDLSEGGNISNMFQSISAWNQKTEIGWTYAHINGVWVPDTYSYTHKEAKESLHKTKKVQFTHHVINESIDLNEFTIEKLGVVKGTRVTDKIAGTTYEYGGSQDPHGIQ